MRPDLLSDLVVTLYKICDWDNHFENAQSRRFAATKWVAMPNKTGFGYNKILRHKNGEAMFGAWCAIIQLASRCSPRGSLQSNGIEYEVSDISELTRFSEKTIQTTLELCCNTLKWVEYTTSKSAVLPRSERGIITTPVVSPILSNSILSNSILPKSNSDANKFTIPELSDISDYCSERKNSVDPQQFLDHYEARGWQFKTGQKMKSWQAAVRTWEKNDFKSKSPNNKFGRQEVSISSAREQYERLTGDKLES